MLQVKYSLLSFCAWHVGVQHPLTLHIFRTAVISCVFRLGTTIIHFDTHTMGNRQVWHTFTFFCGSYCTHPFLAGGVRLVGPGPFNIPKIVENIFKIVKNIFLVFFWGRGLRYHFFRYRYDTDTEQVWIFDTDTILILFSYKILIPILILILFSYEISIPILIL